MLDIEGDSEGSGTLHIIMEYVDGGDLKNLIEAYKKEKKSIPLGMVYDIAKQILKALDYLHSKGKDKDCSIVH